MRTITSDELRSIQLDLLQKTADFCEANGIRYFLCGGTLLGAIRHKGYIPWDDDIDIAMPRTDYDRFCMTFNQPNSKYRVKSLSTHPDYNNAFAKVYDDRTMLKELHYKGIHFGVYIDVLPVDGVKDSAQIKKIMFLHKVLNTKKANYYKRTLSKKRKQKEKLLKKPFRITKRIFRRILSRLRIIRITAAAQKKALQIMKLRKRNPKNLF